MPECVFLKLGGSVLTQKDKEATFRPEVAARLGREIKEALAARPMRLVLGHGAGSFAHFAARRHRTHEGLAGGGEWRGYAETRLAVLRLNQLLLHAWQEVDFLPLAVAPSACALRDRSGKLVMRADLVAHILDAGQVPMVFGDAILDQGQGFGIASTEDVFAALAPALAPRRMILACDVDGVYTADPARDAHARRLAEISVDRAKEVFRSVARHTPGGQAGEDHDVTGGMRGKIERLHALKQETPIEEIRIISGLIPEAVAQVLLGAYEGGTVVR